MAKQSILALLLAVSVLLSGCTLPTFGEIPLPWEQAAAFPTPNIPSIPDVMEKSVRAAVSAIGGEPVTENILDLPIPDWSAEEMETLSREVIRLASKNNFSRLWQAWEALSDAYDTYAEACSLLRIHADLNPEDTALRDRMEALEDEDGGDYVSDAVSAILSSRNQGLFLSAVGCDGYASLQGYSSRKTPEEEQQDDRETELVREYDQAYFDRGSITVTYEGEEWSQDTLDTFGDTLSYSDYYAVSALLEKAVNDALAPLVVELINLRNEIAADSGYDNYYDMLWETSYRRDYTWEEYESIRQGVLDNLKDLEEALYDTGYGYDAYYTGDGYTWDVEGFLAVCAASSRLPQSVRDAFSRLDEANALILAPLSAREGYYTDLLAPENTPVIYWSYAGSMYDLIGVCHEAGHAVNAVLSSGSSYVWYYFSSIDLSEIHSQTTTLLLSREMAVCQPELGEEITHMAVEDVLSSLTTQCLYTDIEHALYTAEGTLTVEKANEIATAAAEPWDYVEDYCYADENYRWAENNFFADSPAYMASYVSSAAASLAIWQLFQTDPQAALDTYDLLMRMDAAKINFRQGLELMGLEDVFSPGLYEALRVSIAEKFPEIS